MIKAPTEAKLEREFAFEWDGGTPSSGFVNLGGGGIVSRTILGNGVLDLGVGLTDGWYNYFGWRVTADPGRIRVAEVVRSDKFQMDLTDAPGFRVSFSWLDYRLHPLDYYDPRYDIGVHLGRASIEHRIYWQSAPSPPVLVYAFEWHSNQEADGWCCDYFLDEFEVPHTDEPTYECEPDLGCWESGSVMRSRGTLWWERSTSVDLTYIPEIPEPATWLPVAAALIAGAAFRRGMR